MSPGYALGLSWFATCALLLQATFAGSELPSHTALYTALSFAPYGCLFFLTRSGVSPLSPKQLKALGYLSAATLGICMLQTEPNLSDDIFRYLWDGKMTTQGVQPYGYGPADGRLVSFRDSAWGMINHKYIPTIYPPIAQLIFGIASFLGKNTQILKGIFLLGHLGTAYVVGKIAKRQGLNDGQAVLLWSMHPLALSETCLQGHVDGLMALAIATSVLLAIEHRRRWSALALSIAAGLKLAAFVLVPIILLRKSLLSATKIDPKTVFFGATLVWSIPWILMTTSSQSHGGFSNYAQRWEGNAGLYPLVQETIALPLHGIAAWQNGNPWKRSENNFIRIRGARNYLQNLRGTALDPWAAQIRSDSDKPDLEKFYVHHLAKLGARVVVLLCLWTLACILGYRRAPLVASARIVLLVALLFSPQVHPWYLLWALPFDIAAQRFSVSIWSAASFAAYTPLDAWVYERTWIAPIWAQMIEYAIVSLAFLKLEGPTLIGSLRAPKKRIA